MITAGSNAKGDLILRNHSNGTALVLEGEDAEAETLSMVVEMLVEELNERDEETAYHLEEYDKADVS